MSKPEIELPINVTGMSISKFWKEINSGAFAFDLKLLAPSHTYAVGSTLRNGNGNLDKEIIRISNIYWFHELHFSQLAVWQFRTTFYTREHPEREKKV